MFVLRAPAPSRVTLRYAAVALTLLLLATAVVLGMAPRWVVPQLSARFPGCLYAVDTDSPAVALTIDDGPDPATTPALLDVLREHDARATFFLISEHVAGADPIVRAMVAGGHEIGNHLTRDEPSIALAPAAFDSALRTAGRRLSAFAPVRWARPGGGRYDTRMVASMRAHGYDCALGSVYPYDAGVPSSRFSSAFILAHVRPGSIIVLHDGGTRGRRTRATLERVLPALEQRGLRVVTLSELTASAAAVERRPGFIDPRRR